MNYYQRLKDMREDHDLKQSDIAKLLETGQNKICDYENGKNMMRIDKYIILAKYYNISLDYLAGIIDEPRKLFLDKESKTFDITEKEKRLIKAFRKHPELQDAINKLLDL